MPGPVAVMGDQITGVCATHLFPNPLGPPQPGPPLPFSAPVTMMVAATVQFGGRPAALAGSSGVCTPPHVGLHPADPFMVPAMEKGTIVSGSATVLVEGKALARTGDPCTVCFGMPGQLAGTVATVICGG